jgi:acetyl esterase/lipase
LARSIPALPAIDFADIPGSRSALASAAAGRPDRSAQWGVSSTEHTAPGLDDDPAVSITFFRPQGQQAVSPALLWIHGGGFVLGSPSYEADFCCEASARLGIVVAAVGYRLAPETRFPGALHDCYAALLYLRDNATDLGIDSDSLAVGGQSAGGGLAAAVTMLARDRGDVALRYQALEVPVLDDRLRTASMTAFVDTPVWDRGKAILSWIYYLGADYLGPDDRDVSPYAAPARSDNLTGLPPAYIATMELDPLRDEGIEYALRLMQAAVSVELHSYPGTFHRSGTLPATVSDRARSEFIEAIGRGLQIPTEPRQSGIHISD